MFERVIGLKDVNVVLIVKVVLSVIYGDVYINNFVSKLLIYECG